MSTKILGNEELNILRAKTPYSLPDNPSDKGFNARQIKTKFWEGYLLLFNWLKETQASLNNDFATTNSALLNESKRIDVILTYFSDGKANFAVKDRNNNIIDETYELKSEASTKFNQLIADIQSVERGSASTITGTQNINADGIQYTITLSNTQNANLSTITQYLPLATTLKAGLLSSTDKEKINNIESDLTNFLANAKAYTDEKLQRDNIVNILGAASHTLIGLLSSEDKKKIDALYSLLGEAEDADTVVNTINEVLAIFSSYPEGVDIVSQLEKKVNYTDVINTLDSEETSKPLSAKMGKELKTEVDTKAELAYVNEELDKKALKSDILVIDEAVTAQESEITTTQSEGDKLVDEIVGYIDGSPRGVYASLSALQSAFPSGTQGVYVCSDNGHWYYWSGTTWTDGGVYQATEIDSQTQNDIQNSKITLDFLTENMDFYSISKDETIIDGMVNTNTLSVNTANSYMKHIKLRIYPGRKYLISGLSFNGTNYKLFVALDENNKKIEAPDTNAGSYGINISGYPNFNAYEYTAPNNAYYLIVNCRTDITSGVALVNVDDTENFNVKKQIEKEINKSKALKSRIIFLGDLHYCSKIADSTSGNYNDKHIYETCGISNNERMDILVKALNKEHHKRKIDLVIQTGDVGFLGAENVEDYTMFLKNFANKFEMPIMFISGNHDIVANDIWFDYFGNNRTYTCENNYFYFLGVDTYNINGTAKPINLIELREKLEIAKSTNKIIIPFAHWWFTGTEYTNLYALFKEYNVPLIVCGHSHKFEVQNQKENYGFYYINDGNFSYPSGNPITFSSQVPEDLWGFLNFEIDSDGIAKAWFIQPEVEYLDINYHMQYTEGTKYDIVSVNKGYDDKSDYNIKDLDNGRYKYWK